MQVLLLILLNSLIKALIPAIIIHLKKLTKFQPTQPTAIMQQANHIRTRDSLTITMEDNNFQDILNKKKT